MPVAMATATPTTIHGRSGGPGRVDRPLARSHRSHVPIRSGRAGRELAMIRPEPICPEPAPDRAYGLPDPDPDPDPGIGLLVADECGWPPCWLLFAEAERVPCRVGVDPEGRRRLRQQG